VNRRQQIANKTINVIKSCNDFKYIQCMDDYVDLATAQILKRNTAESYRLATCIRRAAQYQFIALLKEKELKFLDNHKGG